MFLSMVRGTFFFKFYFLFKMHQIANDYSLLYKMDTETPLKVVFPHEIIPSYVPDNKCGGSGTVVPRQWTGGGGTEALGLRW